MKSFFSYFLLFIMSATVTVTFQNCGDSSMRSNSSEVEELTVDIIPIDEENDGDPDGDGSGDGEFSFNLNRGDNILYRRGAGESLFQLSVRVLLKSFYVLKETTINENWGTTFTNDLPNAYCENSALPHCYHINLNTCMAIGCASIPAPVRCHHEKRMSTAERSETFQTINSLAFVNRNIQPDEPIMMDCNEPTLFFFSTNNTLEVSLANRSCVPQGQYYATAGAGNISTLFENELSMVDDKGDFCNRYASYNWSTTRFTYNSQSSGNTLPENRVIRQAEITFSGEGTPLASLVFKDSGNNTVFCANNVFVNPPQLDAFYPPLNGGLDYKILRPESVLVDGPTHQVTYEDPVDGGARWHFYLSDTAALTQGGGAVIRANQAQAMMDQIEVLVERARSLGQAAACP
jgi:hypothetical protein